LSNPHNASAAGLTASSVPNVRTGRRRTVIGLIVAFWVLITVAGARASGYRQYEDFISALASRGAPEPWFVRVALLCVAAAHLLVAGPLRRRERTTGTAVAVASLCLVAVAAFPITCPEQGAYCVVDGTPNVVDSVHIAAVLGYAASMLAAMVRAGLLLVRHPPERALGVASLVLAAVFVAGLVATQGPAPGTAQRWWALAGQVWIVVAAAGMGQRPVRARVVEDSTNSGEPAP
jgi:hypothetical protein